MYTLVVTDYVWFVMVGLSMGLVGFLLFENHGVTIMANLLIGTISSIMGGLTGAILGLGTPLLSAFLFALMALIMFNLWNLHGMDKTVDDKVRIVRKYEAETEDNG